jgi:hypothetical protein
MWQEVNEVMSGPKLVCCGLCSAISKCMEYVVDAFILMYSCMQEVMSGTYLFSYIQMCATYICFCL